MATSVWFLKKKKEILINPQNAHFKAQAAGLGSGLGFQVCFRSFSPQKKQKESVLECFMMHRLLFFSKTKKEKKKSVLDVYP